MKRHTMEVRLEVAGNDVSCGEKWERKVGLSMASSERRRNGKEFQVVGAA